MNTYKVADLIIKMNPKHNPLRDQAKPYMIPDTNEVDFVIPDITKEVLENQKDIPGISIGESEYMMYASYFYTKLIEYQGIYLHASAVVVDGSCYMFSAPSGTGKSTHTSLWLKHIGNSFILNDDKPAIRIMDNRIYAFGTPFSGKHDLSINEKYLLKGITFIQRDNNNWIKQIKSDEAISLIMGQTVRSRKTELLEKSLRIIDDILTNIPIYKMGCTISKESAYMSYEFMKRLQYEHK